MCVVWSGVKLRACWAGGAVRRGRADAGPGARRGAGVPGLPGCAGLRWPGRGAGGPGGVDRCRRADRGAGRGRALGICRDLGDRTGEADALRELAAVRFNTGDSLAATQLVEQALGIFCDLGDRAGAVLDAQRNRRCTGSAATSRRRSSATSRPWNRPAPSPAPRPRLTRWPAWAAAPWAPATPRKPRPSCGKPWRYSSGSARPRPRAFRRTRRCHRGATGRAGIMTPGYGPGRIDPPSGKVS